MLIVDHPAIQEVMDVETGRHLSARDVIGRDYEELVQLRMRVRTQMRKEDPLYRCSICGVAVHICRSPTQPKFSFKHRHEDGNCPAITAGSLSQDEIDARKYNGAKESQLHRRMKDWLCECMRADGHFSDIEQEPAWKGPLTGALRRPDVRATYNGRRIAFEVQLSTTHLSVIEARRDFYLQEGGLLFWIFAEFDAEHRRMTDDDVFYNNNLNAFVVDAKTVAGSLEAGGFRLECVWAVPTADYGESGLHRRLVSFHELTLEFDRQRAFYFDFDGARTEQEAQVRVRRQRLRDELEAWWEAKRFYGSDAAETWGRFYVRLRTESVSAPRYPGQLPRELLTALFSARHGRPFGQRRKRFIEVAHGVATSNKNGLLWYSHALRHYDRGEQLRTEDQSGKWRDKVKTSRAEKEAGSTAYEPDRTHQQLVEFMFPELCPLP